MSLHLSDRWSDCCSMHRLSSQFLRAVGMVWLVLAIGAPTLATAQHTHEHQPWAAASGDVQFVLDGALEVRPAAAPEHICSLEPTFDDTRLFIRPESMRLHPGGAEHPNSESPGTPLSVPTASIEVAYVDDCGGRSWPEAAIEAFEFAVAIWEHHVASNVPIRVRARWEDFDNRPGGEGFLGFAGPTRVVRFTEGSNAILDTWYPVALASALSRRNVVNTIDGESFDINVSMSCGRTDWHFDTNRIAPPGRFDFATVVLHEIGHGLGSVGTMSAPVDGSRQVTEEIGGWGILPRSGADPLPIVYERFSVDGNAQRLVNTEVYPNPSEVLYQALTGQSGGVFFDGPNAALVNEDFGGGQGLSVGDPPPLYAPNPWRSGSSFSHLDFETYRGTTNTLMVPFISSGASVHSPGPVFCGMLSDMGWPVGEGCTPFFPAGLANLSVAVNGSDVTVSWDAEDGLTNYRVDVAALDRLGRPSFSRQATVQGPPFDVTLRDQPGGLYAVRVVPQEASERRRSTRFTVGLEDAIVVRGPAPSPFRGEARVSFTVQETQPVSVYVYNTAGQRVATLFDGQAEAGQPIERTLDDPRLASGVYYFRFYGEQFDTTETAVRVR